MKQLVLCIASLLTIPAFGQQKPKDIRTEAYTLTIRPAAEPRATGKATGERLLSCSGCTLQDFAQLLAKPHALKVTARQLRTQYDFKLTWKSGELPVHQESIIRALGKEFGLKTSHTQQSVPAFRVVLTSPKRLSKTLEMEDGVAYKKVDTKVYFYKTSPATLATELTQLTGILHEADGIRKEELTLMFDTKQLDETLQKAGITRVALEKKLKIYHLRE
ncbi:DUF3738 domain-containing protein [Arundinibacter roseus]|nr:DUF3738 domain-containing protein [Arundinibacter roseus]